MISVCLCQTFSFSAKCKFFNHANIEHMSILNIFKIVVCVSTPIVPEFEAAVAWKQHRVVVFTGWCQLPPSWTCERMGKQAPTVNPSLKSATGLLFRMTEWKSDHCILHQHNVYGHLFSISWRCSLNQATHTLTLTPNQHFLCICSWSGLWVAACSTSSSTAIGIGICFAFDHVCIGASIVVCATVAVLSTFLSSTFTLHQFRLTYRLSTVIVCTCAVCAQHTDSRSSYTRER